MAPRHSWVGSDTTLPARFSASRRQVGHTILSRALPLYLTQDHSHMGRFMILRHLPHLANKTMPLLSSRGFPGSGKKETDRIVARRDNGALKKRGRHITVIGKSHYDLSDLGGLGAVSLHGRGTTQGTARCAPTAGGLRCAPPTLRPSSVPHCTGHLPGRPWNSTARRVSAVAI